MALDLEIIFKWWEHGVYFGGIYFKSRRRKVEALDGVSNWDDGS